MSDLDPRLTPAREDLAAAALRGKVAAARFVEGRPTHLAAAVADLRRAPTLGTPIDTQVLFGEEVTLFETRQGWSWVQLKNDGYVGYLTAAALAEGRPDPTHYVSVNRTLIYPAPDMKRPTEGALPRGAAVEIIAIDGAFAVLAGGGFVYAAHLTPQAWTAADFVAVAEEFLGSPYLWGGKTSLGIDCSGLVQVALAAAGRAAPRDSDLQETALGEALPIDTALAHLRRGDLVFWNGHVGIMRDAHSLLHANAHHMLVAAEPICEARARIRGKGAGDITSIKRI